MEVDKKILERLNKGDESAFESLFWQYNSHIYNFVLSILYDKSLAEDITQTVFLKIWETHERIDPEQGINAYLFTIARHLVYKETEKKLIFEQASDVISSSSVDDDSALEKQMEANSLRDYILQLIEELPPARKMIFSLSRFEHLSNKEIATRLSISEKTVETQIYRSLQFLREKLSSDVFLACFLIFLANRL